MVRICWGVQFIDQAGVDCIAATPSSSLAILEKRMNPGDIEQLYQHGSFRLVLVEVKERVLA